MATRRKNAGSSAAINSEKLVYTVPEAGKKLGLTRNAAYAAAARGEIPIVRFGKLLKVPKIAFDRMLEAAAPRNQAI